MCPGTGLMAPRVQASDAWSGASARPESPAARCLCGDGGLGSLVLAPLAAAAAGQVPAAWGAAQAVAAAQLVTPHRRRRAGVACARVAGVPLAADRAPVGARALTEKLEDLVRTGARWDGDVAGRV